MTFGAKNAARYAKQNYGYTLKAAELIIREKCAPCKTAKASVWGNVGMIQLNDWYLYSSQEVDRVFSGMGGL